MAAVSGAGDVSMSENRYYELVQHTGVSKEITYGPFGSVDRAWRYLLGHQPTREEVVKHQEAGWSVRIVYREACGTQDRPTHWLPMPDDKRNPPVAVGDTVIDFGCPLIQDLRRRRPALYPPSIGVVAKVHDDGYLRLHRPGDPNGQWDCEHWVRPGLDEENL